MLNASVGVQRVLGRLRRPPGNDAAIASTVEVRGYAAARRVRREVRFAAAAARLVPLVDRLDRSLGALAIRRSGSRSLITRLGPDRTVAVVVAGILLGASLISFSAASPAPATGGTTGPGTDVRIAVGGTAGFGKTGTVTESDPQGQNAYGNVAAGPDSGTDGAGPAVAGPAVDGTGAPSGLDQAAGVDPGVATVAASGGDPTTVEGPFLDDGTLLKPVAVNTIVADGSSLVQTYKVQSGDTLTGIASKFGISMMTIWWANNLESKDALHIGQELSIPPVTGLVVTVTAADTLDSLAQRYGVDPADILTENQLTDPNLVVGQVLVIPGAAGKGIPTPKPPKAQPGSSGGNPGGSSGGNPGQAIVSSPTVYQGGTFHWPVLGGGNYISQYFHYGHFGIDIAADYGSEVRAAGAGTVIFAGWKGNGGGYQVWISHGSNLYTTYNHMSAISVGYGQTVSEGDQVGRVGQSGNATGPHLHFEVWRGPVWAGGTRLNPLGFL